MQLTSCSLLPPDWRQRIAHVSPSFCTGSVVEVRGPKVKAALINAAVGDLVSIEARWSRVRGQVVGVSRDHVVLSCFDSLNGIAAGARVTVMSAGAYLDLGDHLLGAVVNGLGELLAAEGPELSEDPVITTPRCDFSQTLPLKREALLAEAPPPLARRAINSQLFTGVRAIDVFVPIGFGQRLSVMAEPGVGKSTLLGMIAKRSSADVNVIALIGERGREVNEFLFDTLDDGARSRTVAVVSTGDEQPLRRVFAAHTATRIAEYFRSKGLRVLLLMDSLTRLCRAYREVGLAAGEAPVRRGYPPSVFAELPRLIERTGCAERGSITALYTLLLSSDLEEDPMVDEVKGITDGHLMLRSSLAESGHYPAIDVVSSISRLSRNLLSAGLLADVRLLRSLLARLQRDRELALLSDRVDPELSCALQLEPALMEFLRQGSENDTSSGEPLAAQIQSLATHARSVSRK